MKREIKFRAWIPNTGWLAEGFSIAMDGTEWYDDDGHSWPISDLEIMQFTGLKDKNGKEIYEGDILKYDDINWGYGGDYDKENDGYLRVTVPPIDEMLKDDNFEWFRLVFYEVIGNIYENAELLNK